jgi:hypothetical protein
MEISPSENFSGKRKTLGPFDAAEKLRRGWSPAPASVGKFIRAEANAALNARIAFDSRFFVGLNLSGSVIGFLLRLPATGLGCLPKSSMALRLFCFDALSTI